MADRQNQREEAVRLKILAESKYNSKSLKSALKYATRAHNLCPSLSGLSEMLAAFRILMSLSKTSPHFLSSEFYDILGLEPFSPLSSIKAQYKKLVLLLHPDKNTFKEGSGEALKLVNDAFSVLSDWVRRKEYDTKLRQAIRKEEEKREVRSVDETFWTACSRCKLMHKFERKYVGQSLVCPNCNRSFEAVEVDSDDGDGRVKRNDRVRFRKSAFEEELGNSEKSRGDEFVGREKSRRVEGRSKMESKRKMGCVYEGLRKAKSKEGEVPIDEGRTKRGNDKSRNDNRKRGKSEVGEILERKVSKIEDKKKRSSRFEGLEKMTEDEKNLTLAEMQLEALRKKKGKKESGKNMVMRKENAMEKTGMLRLVENGDMEVMTVEDSDFYDFDKDRVERSFKKGQVWAIYDDDDGMPRHYGLIDEVVSVNPFEMKMSWLDLQGSSSDEWLISLEKMGFHISCGRFKVARKDTIKLLNIFSHLVDCERAAIELYRIYPRKGSVWALYSEGSFDMEGLNSSSSRRNRRHYDIVVFLTSYSEIHGLSMAYLGKVDGYRAVFKRGEIGYRAVRWLEKDDIRLFSHQIPARKLSRDDVPHISGDCWELDPASLPPDLLTINSGK